MGGLRPLSALFILLAATPALAQQPQRHLLHFLSGTGFFVGREGYVLTNNHVVQNCSGITLEGAGRGAAASLVARDAENDLALLKAAIIPPVEAELRSEYFPVTNDESVVTVGFPGTSGLTTREARVLAPQGPGGEEKWLQFTDSVAQGNSGGPLLDSAANVIGVVMAKAEIYRTNANAAREELKARADIAITLPVVKRFLRANRVRFRESTGGGILAAHRVEDRAKGFITQVLCRQ